MLKMTDEIDDNTNDVILGFFDGDEYIGGADIEPIRYGEKLLDELNDSIDDFDGRALRRHKLDGGAYLQDIWIERKHRGNGYFSEMLKMTMDFIDNIISDGSSVVLRAYSENPNITDDKLSEIYSRYGFVEIQDTDDDGIIMVK